MKSRLIKEKLFVFASFLLIFAMLLTTASFAWLALFSSEIDASEIRGQLLTNYFHCGTGKVDDPFIITRPIHYYNLVNLYQKVSDYSDHKYYFQVGTQLKEGDDSYYVYNYDNVGNLIEEAPYSQELNLAYYNGENALLPIGTHDKNFLGHFNGNGLTISNFTVSTLDKEYDCDIGIFGFVGKEAEIHDIYFSDVTIDLSNVRSTTEVINKELAEYQTHKSAAHIVNGKNLAYVGYIAGHVLTNSQFTDVYINDMKIVGGGNGSAATSGFGYFGCIEKPDGTLVDALGESLPDMTSGGIGMDEIYTRLTILRDSAGSVPFIESKKVWVNGSQTEDYEVVSIPAIRENNTNSSAGSFSFSKDSSSGEGNTVYLTGKGELTQTQITITVVPHTDGFYLTSQSGTTYVGLNETKTGYIGTTQANACVWAMDNEGRLFTTVVTKYQECQYYYVSSTGITLEKNSAICWTYNEEHHTLTYTDAGGTLRYLAFYGESLGGGSGGDPPVVIKSGNHYLKVDPSNAAGGYIGDTTNPSQAAIFEEESGGYWYTTVGNTTYYLTSNNGLSFTNGSIKTTWSRVNGKWKDEGKNLEITYDGGWKMISTVGISGSYLYKDKKDPLGYVFLGVTSVSGVMQVCANNNETNATASETLWMVPASSTVGKISTNVGGTVYYLSKDSSNNLILTTIEATAANWTRLGNYYSIDDEKLALDLNTTTVKWYLKVSNSGVTMKHLSGTSSGGSGNGESQELNTIFGTIYKSQPQSYQTTTTVNTTTDHPIDTWFPILANTDGTPADDNFGYVISGMQYKQNDLYRSGDIWFTESKINSISDSYSGGAFTDIYTVNASGVTYADSIASFSGYFAAKSVFGTIIHDKTNIHGLHFMNSTVSAADIVTLGSASIYENVYSNYTLPRHCVDVTLEDDGCISLFAGNYYTDNTGFFSLYHVIRDGSAAITEVKKISRIYKQGSNIRYVYDGESTSYDGDLVFSSAWMSGSITQGNKLFYFEIPVTAGEYALGAADGNNGAYLLYLSVAETELVPGDGNGLTENAFQVDVRSTGYIDSEAYVDHSLLQLSVNAPAVSAENFSVEISFTNSGLPTEYSKGLYTISVVNRTGSPIDMIIYLCDDDKVAGNDYLYAYQVVYTNASVTEQSMMNGTKNYFQGCAELTIP